MRLIGIVIAKLPVVTKENWLSIINYFPQSDAYNIIPLLLFEESNA